MNKSAFLDITLFLFVLLFLYTGTIKVIDHTTFVNAIKKSDQLRSYAPVISIVVPLGELLTVLALLIPRFRRLGMYSFLIMMAIFTVYVGIMLYFRSDRPCTCGGIIQQMNWHQHFYFNSAFTMLAAISLWLDKKINKNAQSLIKVLYN